MLSKSILSTLQRGECNDFWKEIKGLKPKKESLPLTVGGTYGEGNIANPLKDNFCATANSVGFNDNRDQVMNELRTVPARTDVVNVHKLRKIVRGLENKKAVGIDGISSEVYKFASERLLTKCKYSFPVACLLVIYRVPKLMHVVIIHPY